MNRLDEIMERQRRELLAVENRAGASMIQTYRDVLHWFRHEVDRLAGLVEAAEARGVDPKVSWLYQQQRTERLLAEYHDQLLGFTLHAGATITDAEQDAVALTGRHVQQSTLAALGPGPRDASTLIESMFDRLPADQLQRLVGIAANGQPLGLLLADLAPLGVERVRAALATGVAAGRGPRAITRDVLDAANVPPARALLIARDQALRAYRAATQARFERSDLVHEWRWHATLSERTCPVCLGQHGSLHPISEPLVSHPACRCTMIPVTPSWRDLGFDVPDRRPEVETGAELFRKLPLREKRQILGPGKLAAYQAGRLQLEDLAVPTSSPLWGPGLREASLRELGLGGFAP